MWFSSDFCLFVCLFIFVYLCDCGRCTPHQSSIDQASELFFACPPYNPRQFYFVVVCVVVVVCGWVGGGGGGGCLDFALFFFGQRVWFFLFSQVDWVAWGVDSISSHERV